MFGFCLNPLCILTEFCSGGSLITILSSKKGISDESKLNWLKEITAGMIHLHKEEIIHRDLAARNVLHK